MSAEHTPGPWIATYVGVEKAVLIGTEDRSTAFACMVRYGGEPGEATQEANAMLIAGAPMLLEAVDDALKAFRLLRVGMIDDPSALRMIDAHIDELQYAIDAATLTKRTKATEGRGL